MSAQVDITLVEGPLGPPTATAPEGAGAWVVFEGVVRPTESERALSALVYEAYEPMTTRELRRLAAETAEEHGLLSVDVEHSVGRVAAGEVSFRLSIGSKHRAEALAAMDQFILRMKQSTPLWKVAEW